MQPSSIQRLVVFAAFTLTMIVFFHEVIFQGRTFQTPAIAGVRSASLDKPYLYPGEEVPFGDGPFIAPTLSTYREELSPHLVRRFFPFSAPLWNPFSGCGHPIPGTDGVYALFPPAAFLFARPGPGSYDAFCLLRLLVAGWGTLLLAFRLGAGCVGAYIAAVAFSLTGYAVGSSNLAAMNADMWLPGMLWATDRLVARPLKFGSALTLGVLISLGALGGAPGALALDAIFCLVFFFWRLTLCQDPSGSFDFLDSAAALLGAFCFAAGVTAFWWMPAAQFHWLAHHATREYAGLVARAIYETIPLFSPHIYPGAYRHSVEFIPPHLGTTFLVLGCCALGEREARGRLRFFFFLVAVAGALKLTGFWVVHWVGWLPFFRDILFVQRLAPLYLSLALLAGLGAGSLFQGQASARGTMTAGGALIVGYVFLLWRNIAKFSNAADAGLSGSVINQVELVGFLIPVAIGLLLFVAYLAIRLPLWAPGLAVVLALAGVVETWRNFPSDWPRRADVHRPAPWLEALMLRAGDRPDRVFGLGTTLLPDHGVVYGLQDARVLSPTRERRYDRYLRALLGEGATEARQRAAAPRAVWRERLGRAFTGTWSSTRLETPMFDLLGVRFLLSDHYLNAPRFHEAFLEDSRAEIGDPGAVRRGFDSEGYYIAARTPSRLTYSFAVSPDGDSLSATPRFHESGPTGTARAARAEVRLRLDESGETITLGRAIVAPGVDSKEGETPGWIFDLTPWAGQWVTLELSAGLDAPTTAGLTALWRDLYLRSWESGLTRFRPIHYGDVHVYENPRALPRAFFADEALVIDSPDRALERMASEGFDPRRTVIVEEDPGPDWPPAAAERPTTETRASTTVLVDDALPPGATEIIRYDPLRVTIKCAAPSPGWLVLSDTFYPGWRAYVDEVRTPVYRANCFMRAVPLAPGNHTVEFRFWCWPFVLGLALGFVTLGVTYLLYRRARVSRRQAFGAPLDYVTFQ